MLTLKQSIIYTLNLIYFYIYIIQYMLCKMLPPPPHLYVTSNQYCLKHHL